MFSRTTDFGPKQSGAFLGGGGGGGGGGYSRGGGSVGGLRSCTAIGIKCQDKTSVVTQHTLCSFHYH